MNCPICDQDLTILDLTSATEHVNTCVEHGPSVIELDDSGQVVVKRNVPPGKQRKICPICDKTFQNLITHFKPCALKYDVPPDLMLQYWDNINADLKKPKKFPRDLLTSFISKCIKEGRVGEQVDYAKALVMSLTDGDPESSNELPDISQASTSDSISSSATSETKTPAPTIARDVTKELLRNAAELARGDKVAPAKKPASRRQKFRIEMVDESVRRANIALRIDRELAASRITRYKEMLHAVSETHQAKIIDIQASGDEDDDECMIVQDNAFREATKSEPVDLGKLFFLARLKNCNGSKLCEQANCVDHELHLLLDDFKSYSGKSMDAPPAEPIDVAMAPIVEPTAEAELPPD